MNLNSLNFFYTHFAKEQMNFLYTGEFSDDLTDRLIELNDFQFRATNQFKTIQRRSAFLIAECFQNIVRHSDISNQNSYFHIRNANGQFSLISGNTIQNDIAPVLKNQLEQLNKLTSDELKEVYRKTLSDGSFSNKGGAGLGLIEMARKSKNKLNFSFSEINELKSYFYFQLLLDAAESLNKSFDHNFENNIFLREIMVKEDLFLVYKGNISTEVTVAILGIIDKTFQSTIHKVLFMKLMNFLEKVSFKSNSAGYDHSIMLLLGENDNKYEMGTNCFLSNSQAMSLDRTLKLYKTLNQEQLWKEQERLNTEEILNPLKEYNLFLLELLKNNLALELSVRSLNDKVSLVSFNIGLEKKKKSQVNLLKNSQKESNPISILDSTN